MVLLKRLLVAGAAITALGAFTVPAQAQAYAPDFQPGYAQAQGYGPQVQSGYVQVQHYGPPPPPRQEAIPGPRYGQQTLDRQQFADLGWFSAVVIPLD